jgi:hypothetical protein
MKCGRPTIAPQSAALLFCKLVRVRSPERQRNLPIPQAVELCSDVPIAGKHLAMATKRAGVATCVRCRKLYSSKDHIRPSSVVAGSRESDRMLAAKPGLPFRGLLGISFTGHGS